MCLLNPSLIYSCGAAEARTREAGTRSHTTHIWMILCQHSLSPKRPQMVHANWAGRNTSSGAGSTVSKNEYRAWNRWGLHLAGTNFSSATRSCGGSVRLRTRQAGRDPSAGARMSWDGSYRGHRACQNKQYGTDPGVWWMPAGKRKECPMCGHTMIDIQACHDLCPNCGARLDCSDGP